MRVTFSRTSWIVFIASAIVVGGSALLFSSRSHSCAIRADIQGLSGNTAAEIKDTQGVVMRELLDKASSVAAARFGTNTPPLGGVPLDSYKVEVERKSPGIRLVVKARAKKDASEFLAAWVAECRQDDYLASKVLFEESALFSR